MPIKGKPLTDYDFTSKSEGIPVNCPTFPYHINHGHSVLPRVFTMSSTPAQLHPDAIPPVGYLSRKALPIKRNDAEPLTREDVQFDLLAAIFTDKNAVFTKPGKTEEKVTFADLYVSALYQSSKCSKVLKDKMVDTPAFATELAKISLLTNVGRINTTMAFFPEMKTALRTYHPVPSLQKTDGNAQDAPRIKNCLKAALLPSESKSSPPSTPDEVRERLRSGSHPPTSVVNLIFVLANHAAPLASVHFDDDFTFLDLFLPNNKYRSVDRAKVFLWLMYRYLEDSEGPNAFDDSYSRDHTGKAPIMYVIAEGVEENEDTAEEIAWGKKMSNQRNAFLRKLVHSLEAEKKKPSQSTPQFVPEPSSSHIQRRTRHRDRQEERPLEEGPFMYYVPQTEPSISSGTDNKRALLQLRPGPGPGPIRPSHHKKTHSRRSRRRVEARSMLQQAWHVITTIDPLANSDEEMEYADENVRLDYTRRIDILSNLLNFDELSHTNRTPRRHHVY